MIWRFVYEVRLHLAASRGFFVLLNKKARGRQSKARTVAQGYHTGPGLLLHPGFSILLVAFFFSSATPVPPLVIFVLEDGGNGEEQQTKVRSLKGVAAQTLIFFF